MKSPLLIVSIWIGTLALAFWGGTSFSGGEDSTGQQGGGGSTEEASSTNSTTAAKIPGGTKTTATGVLPASSGNPSNAGPAEEIDFPPNLKRAMDGGGLVERLGSYLDAVRAMDAGNAQQVIAAFEALPTGYGRHLEMKLLMRSWSTFDPVAALAYANEKLDAKSERRFAVAEALAEWASRDANAALDWAKAQNEDKERDNPLLAGVIKGVAEKDLEAAAKMFFELPPGNARWQASHHLVQKYVEQGVDSAIAWADRIPPDDLNFREVLLGQVGSMIAKKDPSRAAEWADTLAVGEARNRIVNTVLGHWVSQAPAEASTWTAKIDDPNTRRHAMTQMANYWGVRDPVATAQWLNTFPASKDMDPVVGAFVTRISGRDPEGAVGWAMSIIDQERKSTALRQALTAWRRVDEEAAERWSNANAPHLK
ncbi:MAG: hypothetical protein VB997_06890 [Opitutales bacterium]